MMRSCQVKIEMTNRTESLLGISLHADGKESRFFLTLRLETGGQETVKWSWGASGGWVCHSAF